jgi:hypothetical protein
MMQLIRGVALEARETELEDRCAALAWLIDHAAALPSLMEQERADAEAAERRRLAEEARALEQARRAEIREVATWIRYGTAEQLAKFAPDLLREARDLVAAEDRRDAEQEAQRQHQAAEFASQRAGAEAKRIEKARVADEALRVETQSLIARGKFSLAQSVGGRHFAEAADAFAADPGAAPETVAALAAFRRQADQDAKAVSRSNHPPPRSNFGFKSDR